ncbi:MAG: hypothetical protein EOO59_01650 [Hymenobacter sp.]|nr:MAG: hypothetical protein EOO59_01650 [Hymenobacter sp.]
MAHATKHVTQATPENTVTWYFSLENLRRANDAVVALTGKLPVSCLFRRHILRERGGHFGPHEPGDRVAGHLRHGTQILTDGDMSWLMHLGGIVRRRQLPTRVRHAAEIFNQALA